MARSLSPEYLSALLSGFLKPLMDKVRADRDLHLDIRDGYINIYFKGHSLLKLERTSSSYNVTIDPKIIGGTESFSALSEANIQTFVAVIPALKDNITMLPKSDPEAEYEQHLIRANCFDPNVNSDFFFLDRQYASRGRENQVDLLGLYWPSAGRRRGQVVPIALAEVKYGLNHDIKELDQQLTRYYQFLTDSIDNIANDIKALLTDKIKLGLFQAQKDRQEALQTLEVSNSVDDAVICVNLVNYNPNSTLFADALPKLRALPFSGQIRVFHSDFGIWSVNGASLN